MAYHIHIRNGHPEDYASLTLLWEAAVRATHTFLTEEDIVFFRKQIPTVYLAAVTLSVACAADGTTLGFAGIEPPQALASDSHISPAKIAMLFVAPAAHGKGIGRQLIEYIAAQYGAIEVDVNEQNPGATAFYKKCGFVQTGRSPVDDLGKPFPLLHMRRG